MTLTRFLETDSMRVWVATQAGHSPQWTRGCPLFTPCNTPCSLPCKRNASQQVLSSWEQTGGNIPVLGQTTQLWPSYLTLLYQQESTRVRNIKHTESIRRRGNYELGYGEHKSCRVLVLKGNHSNYIMQVEEQFVFLPICSTTFLQAEDHCGFQGL